MVNHMEGGEGKVQQGGSRANDDGGDGEEGIGISGGLEELGVYIRWRGQGGGRALVCQVSQVSGGVKINLKSPRL